MRIGLIIIILVLVPAHIFGQMFKPGTKLYTIETRHFDIIFPDASSRTAYYLAGMADDLFEKYTAMIGSTNTRRIPVVITPDIGLYNGITFPLPYIHIIIQDSPMDTDFGTFSDNLRDAFCHELTHAVNMDMKSPFCQFMYGIFGSPFAFTIAFEPFDMIEGSAISFEDLSGFGRANDPMIQEELREDIYENEFFSPLQVSGSRDIYPYADAYFNYGGLFNKYLQDRFGMEKYEEYWHSIGNLRCYGTNFQQSEYDYWFYSYYFEAAFGLPFKKLWADFKNSLAVRDVSDNTNILSFDYYSISSPVYSKGKIYFIDSFKERVMSYSVREKKYEVVLDNASGFNTLDISKDGRILMISLYGYQNGFYNRRVIFYDLIKKSYLEGSVEDIYSAQFFNKGIIGLKADTHNNCLVYREGEREEILLRGSETAFFWSPVALDDDRIAFILTDKGIKKIMIYEISSHKLFLMRPPRGTSVDYIRMLSSSEGCLMFCYNSNHEFYRLGILEGDRLFLQTNNYAGGVFYPLLAGDLIYYTGKFSKGDKLMEYPYGLTNFNGLEVRAGMDRAELDERTSIPETNSFKVGDYMPLKYMSPFQCWLILPTSYSKPNNNYYTLDSIGVISFISDPVNENGFLFGLGYNYIKGFVNAWGNWGHTNGFPVSINLSAADSMSFNWQNYSYYRDSSGSLNLNYTLTLLPYNDYLIFGLGAGYYAIADDPQIPVSPYLWTYDYASSIVSASAGFSTLLYTDVHYDERGLGFMTYLDYSVYYELYKAEASITLPIDFLLSIIYLNVAYCPAPVLTTSSFNNYFGGDHYPSYREFVSEDYASSYYASGEFSLLVFNAELQNGWFPLYFNRLYMTAGYRGVYLAFNYSQSVYTRLDLQFAVPLGVLSAEIADLYGEAAYNITYNGFYISVGLNIPFSLSEPNLRR